MQTCGRGWSFGSDAVVVTGEGMAAAPDATAGATQARTQMSCCCQEGVCVVRAKKLALRMGSRTDRSD